MSPDTFWKLQTYIVNDRKYASTPPPPTPANKIILEPPSLEKIPGISYQQAFTLSPFNGKVRSVDILSAKNSRTHYVPVSDIPYFAEYNMH